MMNSLMTFLEKMNRLIHFLFFYYLINYNGDSVKTIKESEFRPGMGILIDVKDAISYSEKHNPYSINIYYDKLLLNHKVLLDINKKYYIMCDKGHKSKQAVRILEFYGYDVTYVINS